VKKIDLERAIDRKFWENGLGGENTVYTGQSKEENVE
jgi:hypothetical protein